MPHVKATVLGAGAMGMALGVVLESNGFRVTFWDIEARVVEGIAKHHKNLRSLPNIKLNFLMSSKFSLTMSSIMLSWCLIKLTISFGMLIAWLFPMTLNLTL